MKIIKPGILIAWLLMPLIFITCRKDDLKSEKQFFWLRNKGADMPVWVEGNLASQVFVVVVHGGPGGDAQVYNNLITGFSDPLEKEFAMVYWDQRASGNSAGKAGAGSQTTSQYVDDLDKLVDLLKFRYGNAIKIFLMGHSWGGTLTTAYLLDAQRQNKIRGWIEVDGAHNFKDVSAITDGLIAIGTDQIRLGHRVPEWSAIVNYCRQVNTANPTDAEYSQLNAYGFEVERYLGEVDSIINQSDPLHQGKFEYYSAYNKLSAGWNSLITSMRMFDELKNADFTPQMNRITLPCLLMWGRFDYVVPLKHGLDAYNQISGSNKTMIIFNRSGHSPMLDQQKQFVPEMINWINSVK